MAKTKNMPQKTSKKEKTKISNKKLGTASGGITTPHFWPRGQWDPF